MVIRLSKKDKAYIDISLSFTPSSVTGDLTLLTNERAINNSLKNIMMISAGEVVFQHDVGSGVNDYLFDPMDEATAGVLELEIKRAVQYNEPRVKIVDMTVEAQPDQHNFAVSMTYQIVGSEQEFTVDHILIPTTI
jgi:hypothetical protein